MAYELASSFKNSWWELGFALLGEVSEEGSKRVSVQALKDHSVSAWLRVMELLCLLAQNGNTANTCLIHPFILYSDGTSEQIPLWIVGLSRR